MSGNENDQAPFSNPATSHSQGEKRKQFETVNEPRKSQRVRKEKTLVSDFISSQSIVFLVEANIKKVLKKIPILLNVEDDPKSLSEAMTSRDAAFWKEAINDEFESLISNQTWVSVDFPQGSKAIGCKWVFRRKYNTDPIQTFKARLVVKGFKKKKRNRLL